MTSRCCHDQDVARHRSCLSGRIVRFTYFSAERKRGSLMFVPLKGDDDNDSGAETKL